MSRFAVRLAILSVFVCLGLILGCGGKPGTSGAEHMTEPPARTFEIAVLGDITRLGLLKEIASGHASGNGEVNETFVAEVRRGTAAFRFSCADTDNITDQARIVAGADIVLLTVDASVGPLPIHREHVLLARHMHVTDVAIILTRTHLVDDPELLELEELEMREVISEYGFHGDDALCVLDHPGAGTTSSTPPAKGLPELLRLLTTRVGSRPAEQHTRERKVFSAEVYVLSPKEAFTRETAVPVQSGPATVLIGRREISAEIRALDPIPTGMTGNIKLILPEAISPAPMQRFLVLRNDHISATGFLRPDEPADW